ncbi:hypothetical protein [Tunturibacter empetritectus]|uniref:Uncharacterized protein n=1 Tax=Tunturiibacter lichenicola TaxID=2051959 RepID=A0A7W8J508_9BACT|nr:hypothetical protein [Edaphobacter lichenicola]MBB5342759.1 hypothetical protein [Edaphobacter lichenicola]
MRLSSIVALVRWQGFSAEKSGAVEDGVFIGGFEITVFGRGVLVMRTWWDAW